MKNHSPRRPRHCLSCQRVFVPESVQHVVCNAICWSGALTRYAQACPGHTTLDPRPVVAWLRQVADLPAGDAVDDGTDPALDCALGEEDDAKGT